MEFMGRMGVRLEGESMVKRYVEGMKGMVIVDK